MTDELGSKGLIFANAFNFDFIISHLQTVIIPSLQLIYVKYLKMYINILKDENTIYDYGLFFFHRGIFFNLITIKDDNKLDKYLFKIIFDKTFKIQKMYCYKNMIVKENFIFELHIGDKSINTRVVTFITVTDYFDKSTKIHQSELFFKHKIIEKTTKDNKKIKISKLY